MDGKLLWNTLYQSVLNVARHWTEPPPQRGHPDQFTTIEIGLCWLWTAHFNQPTVTSVGELHDANYRAAMRMMGYLVPERCPHQSTLLRRSQRPDFQAFLKRVNRRLLGWIGPDTDRLLLDSTPLPVGAHSHDADATWGHHGVRGYRLHTLISGNLAIVAWQVRGANVHELRVAPELVRAAGVQRRRVRHVGADQGYDSEPLQRCVRQALRARLIAPLNDRGGRRTMKRTPLRAWVHAHWAGRAVQATVRARSTIERLYSVLKDHQFSLFSLPPWVRHGPTVERWSHLKITLYHTFRLLHTGRTMAAD